MEINQVLHGYSHGHQLLNSSCDLSVNDKRALLFLSDLSGSNLDVGFDSYITGYPLPDGKYYALAKTWYAHEMARPGCVWTHTLLISFTQIGKIPEFNSVINLFQRPITGEYKYYNSSLYFNPNFSYDYKTVPVSPDLLYGLYHYSDTQLFLYANDSKTYETEILSIWSNQWPRLRRKFTFCTGSLSNRSTSHNVFDLQVFPSSHIRRNSKHLNHTLELNDVNLDNINDYSWINLVNSDDTRNSWRSFLWLYGSGVTGSRENYIPLLKLYLLLQEKATKISDITKFLSIFFSSPTELKNLKNLIYKERYIKFYNNVITFDRYEVIIELITTSYRNVLPIELYSLDESLLQLSTDQLIKILHVVKDYNYSLSSNFFIELEKQVSQKKLLELIQDDTVRNIIVFNSYNHIYDVDVWMSLNEFKQTLLLNYIEELAIDIDWKRFIFTLLDSRIRIYPYNLFKISKSLIITYILDWLNVNPNEILPNSWEIAFEHHDSKISVIYWINETPTIVYDLLDIIINKQYDINIFNSTLSLNGLNKLTDLCLNGKDVTKKYYKLLYLFYITLGVSLAKREWILARLFQPLHDSLLNYNSKYVLHNPFSNNRIVNKSLFYNIISFFKNDITYDTPDWDNCERLRRIFVHTFISFDFDIKAFLLGLSDDDITFNYVINYCLSTKKGKKFMSQIIYQYKKSNLLLTSFQTDRFAQIEKKSLDKKNTF